MQVNRRNESAYGYVLTLRSSFGRRYFFRKNLRQLAISIGVGLVLKPRRHLMSSEYTAEFTGSEDAVQRFEEAIAIWRSGPSKRPKKA